MVRRHMNSERKSRPLKRSALSLSNHDGKTIAEKALFYKGFRHFCRCKFRFALLVFEPSTPMYFIKIFRNIKVFVDIQRNHLPFEH